MIFQSSGFSRGRAISSPCVLKLDVFNFNRYIVFKYHHGNQFLTVKLLVSPPDGVLVLPDLLLVIQGQLSLIPGEQGPS